MEFVRSVQAGDDDARRALRLLGGVLLGVGALVLAFRRSNFDDPWGDLPILVVVLIPAIVLYGGGFLAARAAGGSRAWHGVFLVFGLVFAFLTLNQFVELVGGDPGSSLNTAWIFAVVAALGALAALRAGVRFAMLAAGLAFLIAWLSLWDEVISDGIGSDAGTLRGLSILAAVVIGLAGVALHWRLRGRTFERPLIDDHLPVPAELFTAAGIAFVFGAGLVSLTGAIEGALAAAFSPLGGATGGSGFAEPSLFWDLVLLAGSLKLILIGAWIGMRGPVYVGALGLTLFTFLVGLDLDDSSPSGSVVGWPLVLLLAAAALLAASALLPARTARSRTADSAPPPA
jgi:hypothetical protein